MTDPSSGDRATDGGVSDEFDDVGPDAVGDADGSGGGAGSPGVAVATALLLGVLGPVIALAGGVAVFAIDSLTGGLSLVASVVLTLVFGQYVAFGGLAVGYLAWRGFDREGIVSYLGVRVPSLKEIGIVLGSWVVILILILVVSTIVQLLGTETAANQSAELAMGNPAIIPLFVAASFLVIGPCEEILYRGVVQGRLRESLPAAPSIALAAAIFATIHVMALTGGLSARLTTISILFVPSLVFGAVYEYTENLVVPALLHGLHNAVIFTVLYVTVTQVDPNELPTVLGFFPV
ncbi:CPBP family intramembrane metalloprotease [Halorubrum ezzemoulense DSM 17463]|uniref:CPBP family intramembrane metalloprotease n=1 Tax=Halorubrum ezzemoulense DSM 17463 TaxID=1121945 RepID=A0A1X4G7T4_HALEZ|nr:type II CAAX endopeptidase family protein [Halorubrum ezzemoulense]OSO90998.1 CPBP family intramembrane metalloprotease [Halorubrum ezzemoulense DSM 17463]